MFNLHFFHKNSIILTGEELLVTHIPERCLFIFPYKQQKLIKK